MQIIFKRPLLFGLFVFCLLMVLTQYLTYQKYLLDKAARYDSAMHAANMAKDRLQASLQYSIAATRTLDFIIDKYGFPDNFDGIAKDLIAANKHIDAIELVRGGIITHVYPLKGNESVIGYNVLADQTRNKEAFKAINSKEMFFAGPLKLRQGGIGVVGRHAMFRKGRFVGFSVVIIKLSTLLNAAGIAADANSAFEYQLSKVDPDTKKEEFFIDNTKTFGDDNTAAVEMQTADWKIYARAKQGILVPSVLPFAIVGFIFSIVGGVLAWYLLRQPEKLTQEVREKTLLLGKVEQRYSAIVQNSFHALFLLRPGETVLEANEAACQLFGYTQDEFRQCLVPAIFTKLDQMLAHGVTQIEPHTVQGEVQGIKKNGIRFPCEISAILFKDITGGQYASILAIDISDRKQQETRNNELLIANIAAKNQLQTVLQSISDGFIAFDKDWNFTYINEKGAFLFEQHTPAQLIGRNLCAIFPELTTAAFFRNFEYVMQRRISLTVLEYFELGARYVENRIYPSDDGGITVTCKDVTSQIAITAEVKRSQEALKKIMDSSVDVICTMDAAGNFSEVSCAALEVWGYTPAELIGQPFMDLVLPEDYEKTISAAKDIAEGNPTTNFENSYVKKDGTIVPIIWSARWDENEQSMYCIAKDGTEKRRIENEKALGEQRFKSLVQDGSDLISVLDPEGCYLYKSPSSLAVLGRKSEEFSGECIFDFIHTEDVNAVRDSFLSLEPDSRVTLEPFRFRHKDGNWRWLETTFTNLRDNPAVKGIVTTSRDVSERIEVVKAIRESEIRYRYLFDNNPQPMYIFNLETQQIMECNKRLISKYGYEHEEFSNFKITNFRPEEDWDKVLEAIADSGSFGERHPKIWRHLKKNGDMMYVEIIANIIEFNGVRAALVLIDDVTERHNYVKAIEKQNASLQEIAWVQSHVVRAPLARIMGLADFLKNHTTTEEEREQLLSYIGSAAEEFDVIVKDIIMKADQVRHTKSDF